MPFLTPPEDIPRGTTPIYLALLFTVFAGFSLLAGRTRPFAYMALQHEIGVVRDVYDTRKGTTLEFVAHEDLLRVSDPDLPQVGERMRALHVNDTITVVYDTHAWHLWALARGSAPLVSAADIQRWQREEQLHGRWRAALWGALAVAMFSWFGVTLYRDPTRMNRSSATK